MHIRLRKLIGTLIMIPFVVIYCLAVMVLAVRILPETSGWLQLIFYVVAGFAWVLPVGVLIRWMVKPDPETN